MDETTGIVIKVGDDEVEPKDWWIQYQEKKKPVSEEIISQNGKDIVLVNFNPENPVTDIHRNEIRDFIVKSQQVNPYLIEHLNRIVMSDTDMKSRYNDEENYPVNGTVLPSWDGVWLTRRGGRADLEHRIGGHISTFIGTVAHEGVHLAVVKSNLSQRQWDQRFGWHPVGDFLDDWELIGKIGDEDAARNKLTGKVASTGWFTDHPEWCVTDYATMAHDDDIADSGVVAIFDPKRLQGICKDKFEIIKNLRSDSLQGSSRPEN